MLYYKLIIFDLGVYIIYYYTQIVLRLISNRNHLLFYNCKNTFIIVFILCVLSVVSKVLLSIYEFLFKYKT